MVWGDNVKNLEYNTLNWTSSSSDHLKLTGTFFQSQCISGMKHVIQASVEFLCAAAGELFMGSILLGTRAYMPMARAYGRKVSKIMSNKNISWIRIARIRFQRAGEGGRHYSHEEKKYARKEKGIAYCSLLASVLCLVGHFWRRGTSKNPFSIESMDEAIEK